MILIASAVAGMTAAGIPKGFLLYEKAAAKKDDNPETSWTVSARKAAKLVVNPCDKAGLGQKGRAAAKTIVYTAVPDFARSEQVVLYADETAAGQAMAELTAAVARCGSAGYKFTSSRFALGDEAQKIVGQAFQKGKVAIGGERAVVVRRANALILYTQAGEWGKPAKADFAQQGKDATRMLAKICQIADC